MDLAAGAAFGSSLGPGGLACCGDPSCVSLLHLKGLPQPNTEARVTISKSYSELNIRLGQKAALVHGSFMVPEAWSRGSSLLVSLFIPPLASYRPDLCGGSSG